MTIPFLSPEGLREAARAMPPLKTRQAVFLDARRELIKRAAVTIDDLTPGLYIIISKDETSEVEPRTIVIFNLYVQTQQLKHFEHFYFVRL
jgi:hypothetical protein